MKFKEAKAGPRGPHLVEPQVLELFELHCTLFGIYIVRLTFI